MRVGQLTGGLAAAVLAAWCLFGVVGAAPASVADAARVGDRAAVRSLLKEGADVNQAQGDGVTALHWAARLGDIEMAQMLLAAGGNAQATTRSGRYTPLHLAAERASAPLVAALIKAGADVNVGTSTGATPLMFAAGAGDIETITALLDAHASANAAESFRGQTPLIWAAAANQVAAVKLLIARGANPRQSTKIIDFAALSRDGGNPEGRNLQIGRASCRERV